MVGKNFKTEKASELVGGKGSALMIYHLEDSELPEKCGIFAEIVLEPGATVGYHQHVGDNELYYIIEGKGLYTENGEEYEVDAGTRTMVYDGDFHGLDNTGEEPLKFLAVVIKE